MSIPRSLELPACAHPVTFTGTVGPLAGLRADPGGDARGDLLLVPGFTGSKEDFLAVLDPLARLGWRVTTYDQRGQYESPGPDDPAAYTLDGFAADLAAVAGTLPGPPHVVAHSFGGLVARQAVLADPIAYASLLLLCSGPGPTKVDDHVALGFVRDQLRAIGLEQMYELTLAYSGRPEPPGEIGAFVRRRYTANSPVGLAAMAGLLLTAPDRTPELAALAAGGFPVEVAYGEADDAWPLAEQDAVARAVGRTAHVIPGTGHSPAVDDPDATASLISHLAERAIHPGG